VTPDAEPVAERRVCSVLFCDVVGFGMAAQTPPHRPSTRRAIGARLRCQPLLDRADATEGAAEHAQHQIRA